MTDEDRRMLLDLFDRGGQTEGYYRQHNGRDMIALKAKNRHSVRATSSFLTAWMRNMFTGENRSRFAAM